MHNITKEIFALQRGDSFTAPAGEIADNLAMAYREGQINGIQVGTKQAVKAIASGAGIGIVVVVTGYFVADKVKKARENKED